ncbi:MAG: LysR family transcriptional regulator [Pseudomonadota bacterium]
MTKHSASEPLIDPMLVRTFLAVADEGSISRGARRVFRTQSTASTQIQTLEEQLGVRLFERDTRRLALTEEGERFMSHAQRLLEVNHQALVALRAEVARPTLRIGFSEYFHPERLGQIVRRLHGEWPEYRFDLRVAQSRLLALEFEANRLDLAVLSKLVRPARSGARAERLHWVSSAELALPAQGPLPLVLLSPECALHALALELLDRAGTPRRVAVICSGTAGIQAALRGGLGLGCLNEGSIPSDLRVRTDRRLPSLPGMRFEWRARAGTPAARVASALSASLAA